MSCHSSPKCGVGETWFFAAAGEALRGECLALRVAMLKDLGFQRGTDIQSEDGLIEGGAYLALHNDSYRTMFLGCVCTNETATEAKAGALMVKDGSTFSVCNFPRLPSGEKHPAVVLPLGVCRKTCPRVSFLQR